MKNLSMQSICDFLEEMANAFWRAGRQGARALRRMEWPQLLATCVLIALILSILPLALFLFTVFMILKILIAGSVVSARKQREPKDIPQDPPTE